MFENTLLEMNIDLIRKAIYKEAQKYFLLNELCVIINELSFVTIDDGGLSNVSDEHSIFIKGKICGESGSGIYQEGDFQIQAEPGWSIDYLAGYFCNELENKIELKEYHLDEK